MAALAEAPNLYIGERYTRSRLLLVAAHSAPPERDIASEEYGRSHSAIRPLGEIALNETVDLNQIPQYEMVKANILSGVVEMLGTDSTSTEVLDIDPEEEYPIVNGRACDKDGTPLVQKVANGAYKSATLASEDDRFIIQSERDWYDVEIANIVDGLMDGQSHITVSMKPVEGLAKHPEIYKDQLGYGDLVYVQRYSRSGYTTTHAASSIMVKDIEAFKKELAAKGFIIPKDEPSSKWILHGQTHAMSAVDAKAFVHDLRQSYYERVGLVGDRKSATEYVRANQQVFDVLFDTYFPELAKAIFTEKNNPTLQGLAQTMLATDLSKMKKGIRTDLTRIAHGDEFNDELGKTMETIIRYSIVEQLRQGLRLAPKTAQTDQAPDWSTNILGLSSTASAMSTHYTNQLMAWNLSQGVRAGRSYGGCPGQVELADDDMEWGSSGLFSNNTAGDFQWFYGRRGRRSKSNKDDDDCEFVSKKCPECKTRNVKTVVKKISSTHKRISGSCNCVKIVSIKE